MNSSTGTLIRLLSCGLIIRPARSPDWIVLPSALSFHDIKYSLELIKKVRSYNRFFNPDTLTKAYNFALEAHKNQKRDEGIPYISHPIAVANILTELKLDSATITTGLLHDTIEDTKATYDSVKKEFGKEVADLVEGVTKISAIEEKAIDNSKAENLRKLILATSKAVSYTHLTLPTKRIV